MSKHADLRLTVITSDQVTPYEQVNCRGEDGEERHYIAVKCGDVFHPYVYNDSKDNTYKVTINVDGNDIGTTWKIGPGRSVGFNASTWGDRFVQRYDLVFALPPTATVVGGQLALSAAQKIGTIEMLASKHILRLPAPPGSVTHKRKGTSDAVTPSPSPPPAALPSPFQIAAKKPAVDGQKFWETSNVAVGVGPPCGPAQWRQNMDEQQRMARDVYDREQTAAVVHYCTLEALQLRLANAQSASASASADDPPSLEPESTDHQPIDQRLESAKRAKLEARVPAG